MLRAFKVGKGIAGLDSEGREALHALREEMFSLRANKGKLLSVVSKSGRLLIAEKAAQQKMARQVRQLQVDNRSLRDELGFFE